MATGLFRRQISEVGQIARIGQLVEVEYFRAVVSTENEADEIGTDEAAPVTRIRICYFSCLSAAGSESPLFCVLLSGCFLALGKR